MPQFVDLKKKKNTLLIILYLLVDKYNISTYAKMSQKMPHFLIIVRLETTSYCTWPSGVLEIHLCNNKKKNVISQSITCTKPYLQIISFLNFTSPSVLDFSKKYVFTNPPPMAYCFQTPWFYFSFVQYPLDLFLFSSWEKIYAFYFHYQPIYNLFVLNLPLDFDS